MPPAKRKNSGKNAERAPQVKAARERKRAEAEAAAAADDVAMTEAPGIHCRARAHAHAAPRSRLPTPLVSRPPQTRAIDKTAAVLSMVLRAKTAELVRPCGGRPATSLLRHATNL